MINSFRSKKIGLAIIIVLLTVATFSVYAQDGNVPDVTGLNIPQAATELNRAGLRFGELIVHPWSEASPFQPGRVAEQSVLSGEVVEPGTGVDLTVLSGAKLTLIYDDNDLTLINDADEAISLNSIRFRTADGAQQFDARRWRRDLPVGDCTQVWSVGRGQPKSIDGCDSTYWLVTNDTAEHFWTQTVAAESFTVVQNGGTIATCDTAPRNSQDRPTTCEFYVAGGSLSSEATDFVYLAYTTDRFAVINVSDDRWMPLDQTTIYNFNPSIQVQGAGLNLSDSSLFPDASIIASTQRLAPGQCLMLTVEPLTDAQPPQPCDVIAQRPLVSEVIFWSAPFELDASSGERSQCPAADANRMTLCIMPR